MDIFEPEGRGEAEVLSRRSKSISDISISIVVIMLLVVTLYGFCAADSISQQRTAEAAVFGFADGTVAVTPDSVPHPASDQGVPSSINRFGSTNTTNAYIPTRFSQRTQSSAFLSETGSYVFALSYERGKFTTDTPEFTPFLYIKTTHKRE